MYQRARENYQKHKSNININYNKKYAPIKIINLKTFLNFDYLI